MKKEYFIKQRMKKIGTFALVLSIIVGSGDVSAKTSYAKASNKKQNYIVLTKEEKIIGDVKDKYQNVETTSDSIQEDILDSKMTTVALTKDEVEEVKSTDKNVIVEKDSNVYASAKGAKIIKRKDIDMEWNKKIINYSYNEHKKPKDKVKIAILDSGVDYGNDINLEESISLVPGEEEMNPLFMDGTGHGNSVAGLIGAENNDEGITGINPDAVIYSVRVLDDENKAPLSRIIEGIYYCIDKKVNIINMSFGTSTYSETLKKAIDDANEAGILIIAAAGNTGGEVEYPAAFPNVLAVGAVDSDANITDSSAKGDEVQILAPGENVCSTGEFGDVLISSGTSLAAPQVAAAASVLWEKDKSVSKEFVRDLLVESANHSKSKKYGVLDISYAIKNYDMFKKRYNKLNNRDTIEVNSTDIITIKDTGCVKGSWSQDSHVYLVGSGHSNVKEGARYPDKETRFKGITDNPGWHGSFHINYVAAYIYATRMAEQLGKEKLADSAPSVAGLSASEKKNMLGDVAAINWSSLGMTSKGKRRAFVWGMAMHIAADVFAHSAFVKSGGAWCHLGHGKYNGKVINNYADHTGKYEERFQAAENVVGKIVAKYDAKNGGGSYVQFKGVSTVKQTFRLKDLSLYANATDSSADLSGLTNYSVSSGVFNYYWKG